MQLQSYHIIYIYIKIYTPASARATFFRTTAWFKKTLGSHTPMQLKMWMKMAKLYTAQSICRQFFGFEFEHLNDEKGEICRDGIGLESFVTPEV